MDVPDGAIATVLMAVVVPFLVLAALVLVLAVVEGIWGAGAGVEPKPARRELPVARPYDDGLPKAA